VNPSGAGTTCARITQSKPTGEADIDRYSPLVHFAIVGLKPIRRHRGRGELALHRRHAVLDFMFDCSFVYRDDLAVVDHDPAGHHRHGDRTDVRAVHELPPHVVERGEGKAVEIEKDQIRLLPRSQMADRLLTHAASAALRQALQDFIRPRPTLVVRIGDAMDQARHLGDCPHIGAIVGRTLVGAQRDRDTALAHLAEWHDATAELEIAHRIVSDHLAGSRQQIEIVVIDPDQMDRHHALVEETQIVHAADQRFAPFPRPMHALQLTVGSTKSIP
jgi:hypothetical protein